VFFDIGLKRLIERFIHPTLIKQSDMNSRETFCVYLSV